MLNVSGHLISTAEVENALLLDPNVSEAAVVGRKHPVKGECLYCFVTLKDSILNDHMNGFMNVDIITQEMKSELCQMIRTKIGPFATPDYIQVIIYIHIYIVLF